MRRVAVLLAATATLSFAGLAAAPAASACTGTPCEEVCLVLHTLGLGRRCPR